MVASLDTTTDVILTLYFSCVHLSVHKDKTLSTGTFPTEILRLHRLSHLEIGALVILCFVFPTVPDSTAGGTRVLPVGRM